MDDKRIVYAKQIGRLVGQYLQTHSQQAVEELKNLYDTTKSYNKQYQDFSSVMATHAHMLALHNIEDNFQPHSALGYAITAKSNYENYIAEMTRRHEAAGKTKIWLDQIILIEAYCRYQIEDFSEIVNSLMDAVSPCAMALGGSALTRIAVEQNADFLYSAYSLLKKMDEIFQPPEWIFEEDIYRIAYEFLSMFYTHDIKIIGDNRIPYDVNKALEGLYKVAVYLKDPQQKEWILDDIQGCRIKL